MALASVVVVLDPAKLSSDFSAPVRAFVAVPGSRFRKRWGGWLRSRPLAAGPLRLRGGGNGRRWLPPTSVARWSGARWYR